MTMTAQMGSLYYLEGEPNEIVAPDSKKKELKDIMPIL
jgi:hypothetical protein